MAIIKTKLLYVLVVSKNWTLYKGWSLTSSHAGWLNISSDHRAGPYRVHWWSHQSERAIFLISVGGTLDTVEFAFRFMITGI